MSLFKLMIVLMILPVLMVFGTLYRNDAHLLEDPGFSTRIKIFFTSNQAFTEDKPVLPELQTPVFDQAARDLFGQIMHETIQMGWVVVSDDREAYEAQFTVRSPVFLFEDDVFVRVEAISSNTAALHIKSQSQLGKADLAANSSHIQRLIKRLAQTN